MNKLEGYEVECKNAANGKIVWMVVREVDGDELMSIRDKENSLFCTKYYPVYDTASEFTEKILHIHSGRFGQAILMQMLRNYRQSLRTKTESEKKDMQVIKYYRSL